jgi:hypothetical protein
MYEILTEAIKYRGNYAQLDKTHRIDVQFCSPVELIDKLSEIVQKGDTIVDVQVTPYSTDDGVVNPNEGKPNFGFVIVVKKYQVCT